MDGLHAAQVAYWNGAGGDHWVSRQDATDRVFTPVAEIVPARAAAIWIVTATAP